MKRVDLTLMLACGIAGAVAGFVPIAASADPVVEQRPLPPFSQLVIEGSAEVTLVQGTAESVVIEAPPSVAQSVRTTVRGRTLTISARTQQHWWEWFSGGGRTRTPRITVNFRTLDRVEAAGSVKIFAERITSDDLFLDLAGAGTIRIADLQAQTLKLDGSGAVKAEIAGKAVRQEIDLSGAGSYLAPALASTRVSIEVSGAGKAIVNASDTLRVDISGAGVVEYLGDPKVNQSISGIGTIRRREK